MGANLCRWNNQDLAKLEVGLRPMLLAACECDRSSVDRAERLLSLAHSLTTVISFEIVGTAGALYFQEMAPAVVRPVLERHLAAAYPEAGLDTDCDALRVGLDALSAPGHLLALEYRHQFPFYTPLQGAPGSADYDPLMPILAALSQLQPNQVAMLQIIAVPATFGWNERGAEMAMSDLRYAAPQQRKLAMPLFKVALRAACISPRREDAFIRLGTIDSALRRGISLDLDALRGEPLSLSSVEAMQRLLARRPFCTPGFILSTAELANLWHLPWGQTPPELHRLRGRQAPAPPSVHVEGNGIPLGWSTYRNNRQTVYFKASDRRQHVFAIGATRTGKTTAIANWAALDMRLGHGVVVIDPHGDLANHLLTLVPPNRINDVIYFDPADEDHPMGFNLLDGGGRPSLAAGELLHLFRTMWASAWGPRMHDILHNCLLTLMELPGATIADLPGLLTSPALRRRATATLTNQAVREFWEGRYNRWPPSQQMDSAEPILNKVNAFLADPLLRHIVGQSRSAFGLREVLDRGSILICNLSRGRLGDENASLLGGALLSKLELAAISRAQVPETQRRDVYVYVDEFQRMATSSFVSMFSELAKYRVNLVAANQYCAQLPEEVRQAIFGNVGTLIAFRVGPTDASFLARYLSPAVSAEDLMSLDNYRAYVRLAAGGQTTRAFSLLTFPPQVGSPNVRAAIQELCRRRYSRSRGEVATEMARRADSTGSNDTGQALYPDVDEA